MAEEVVETLAEVVEEGPPQGGPSQLPAVRAHEAVVARDEITVSELLAQRDKVIQAMQQAMRPGVHYGAIPGTSKPTLLKPGAELLNVLFRLAPSYRSEKVWHDDGHLTVTSTCTLTHIPTGYVIAEGEGLCSTLESKYAYRNKKRACPNCDVEAIIKGKEEYGGGWLCWKKEGGCGAKYVDGDARIEAQDVGKTLNPDLADSFNTVLKMAAKRALIAAVLNGTAASDVFTQDIEDGVTKLGGSGADTPSAGASGARGDSRAEPPAQPPHTILPPGFPAGPDLAERIGQALNHVDPSVDWRGTWDNAIVAMFGKPRSELDNDERAVAWTRLAHVAADLSSEADFPPLTSARIKDAFAAAFETNTPIEVLYHKADNPENTS